MENKIDLYKQISMEQFDYLLPDERIAKYPMSDRDKSKLLRFDNGKISESQFSEVVNFMDGSELLIFNNTKVIHARLFFKKATGAVIEVFCLEPSLPSDYACNFAQRGSCEWRCLVGNLKKWKSEAITSEFTVNGVREQLSAEKIEINSGGEVTIRFNWTSDCSFAEVLESCGKIPIPPYLNRESESSDNLRYQTVYSKNEGSVAAPTAGLHFTENIISTLNAKGVLTDEVTLHVGAGTFRPVKSDQIGGHDMHTEHIVVKRDSIENILKRSENIIAVGTTSVRTLESLYWMGVKCILGMNDFNHINQWEPYSLPSHYSLHDSMQALIKWFDNNSCEILKAATTIIIVPGYKYRVVKKIFTNFHQPHSTLLLLVAAAIGDSWKEVYSYAMEHDFRFLSYGDSSLLRVKSSF